MPQDPEPPHAKHNLPRDQRLAAAWVPAFVAFALFLYQAQKCCRDPRAFVDDPFISLRFAANLFRHGELSFNPGTRIEGYSNLLHVLVQATTFKVLGRVPSAATAIDQVLVVLFGATVVHFALLFRLARVDSGYPTSRLAWYFAAILTMAGLPVAFWATAGLETPIEGLLYTWVVLAALRIEAQSRWSIIGLLLPLTCVVLVRFEGILVAMAIVASLAGWLFFRGKKRRAIALVGWLASFGTAYHLWRWTYFGQLLPNTYTAKATGGSTLHRLDSGLHYCGNWVAWLGGGVTVVAVLLAVASKFEGQRIDGESRVGWWSPSSMVAAVTLGAKMALVTVGGGDWMPGFRMLVPVVPLAAFLAVRAVIEGCGIDGKRFPRSEISLAFALAIPFVARGVPFILGVDTAPGTGGVKQLPSDYVAMGKLVADHFHDKREQVAIGEAGVIPFVAIDAQFLDLFGLVDSDMAGQPGGMHQRVHVPHFLQRRPGAVIFAHLSVRPPFGPYQYGPELLKSTLFHSAYRRVRIPNELDESGWAVYARNDIDLAAKGLAWLRHDPLQQWVAER